MELDPQEWLQIDLLAGTTPEPKTLDLFRKLLRAGDTDVGIGSDVKFHALMAEKLVRPGGHMIALDPQPYNCDKLLINCQIERFDQPSRSGVSRACFRRSCCSVESGAQ